MLHKNKGFFEWFSIVDLDTASLFKKRILKHDFRASALKEMFSCNHKLTHGVKKNGKYIEKEFGIAKEEERVACYSGQVNRWDMQ